MAAPIPTASLIRLETALKAWPLWLPAPQCEPVVHGTLHDSGRNLSLLVTDQRHHWVVRIATQRPATLSVDSRLELRCLQLAADAGLAPRPSYANPDAGLLVCPYLDNDADVGREESLQGAAELLRALHALPASGPTLNLGARWANYAGTAPLDRKLLDRLSDLEQSTPALQLCHNDLLSANRLRHKGRWYALDFEYAAWGDPCLDLAVIIEADALSDAETALLLTTYANVPTVPDALLSRVQAWRDIYRYTANLWSGAANRANVNRGSW